MEFGSDISVSHKNVLDLHTFNRTLNVLVIKPVHLACKLTSCELHCVVNIYWSWNHGLGLPFSFCIRQKLRYGQMHLTFLQLQLTS